MDIMRGTETASGMHETGGGEVDEGEAEMWAAMAEVRRAT